MPEDRRQHGVVLEMPVAANASLANLQAVSRSGLIDRGRERDWRGRYVERLRIKTPFALRRGGVALRRQSAEGRAGALAGHRPAVLILDEPTQGVDVGSKSEIHQIMVDLAEQGMAIVMISSELPEILGMSDRIAVMHAGSDRRASGAGGGDAGTILALALGHARAATSSQGVFADRRDSSGLAPCWRWWRPASSPWRTSAT